MGNSSSSAATPPTDPLKLSKLAERALEKRNSSQWRKAVREPFFNPLARGPFGLSTVLNFLLMDNGGWLAGLEILLQACTPEQKTALLASRCGDHNEAMTPVQYCCTQTKHDFVEFTKLFINAGADPNAVFPATQKVRFNGQAPLFIAVNCNATFQLQYLLALPHIDMNAKHNGQSLLAFVQSDSRFGSCVQIVRSAQQQQKQ
jgi:hypothetical protein